MRFGTAPSTLLPFTLALLLALVPLTTGCQSEKPSAGASETAESAPHIPFREDGSLRFYGAAGADTLEIAVEIAESDSARRRGLMERDSLPPMSGMLFLFERERPRSFTMSNMDMSIDILFVGADRTVVSISRYAQPGTPQVRSEQPARYVVEVPAGFADRYGVVEGDSVSWQREPQ
mgnify:CR=1 FL=1